jgi:hypothetical protein
MTETTNPSNADSGPGFAPDADALDASVIGDAGRAGDAGVDRVGEGPDDDGAFDEQPEPRAPEAYDLKPPEGAVLDARALKVVEPVFRDLDLSNDQAQALTDAYAKDVLPQVVQQVQSQAQQQLLADIVSTRKAWADEFTRDPEIGGSDEQRGEKLAVMAKAIDDLMGPRGSPEGDAFRQLLNETGLGNNPTIGRLLFRAGQRLAEASIHHSQAGGASSRSMAEKMYDPAYQPKAG